MRATTNFTRLLGPLVALATIRPPKGSYDDWERFLREANEAGVAALEGPDGTHFAGPLGFALLRRWRWLRDSRERGISYYEANRAFEAAIERDGDAIRESMHRADEIRQRAMAERDGKKAPRRRSQDAYQPNGNEDDGLLEYADRIGL